MGKLHIFYYLLWVSEGGFNLDIKNPETREYVRVVIYRHYLPVPGVGNSAPAAFLGFGSDLSGSLSGIEP